MGTSENGVVFVFVWSIEVNWGLKSPEQFEHVSHGTNKHRSL